MSMIIFFFISVAVIQRMKLHTFWHWICQLAT